MKSLAVAFVWHLHQPYYTDPLTKTAPLPWVRLHATKGYFDMAVMLEEHPDMRATVNLTPSLLLQIQEQGQETVRDRFWTHAAKPAGDLSEEERIFILRHFFAANWETMVRPHDRYYSLLTQRGRDTREAELPRIAARFSTQDILDLQVWHNLAWFGHRALAQYPLLRELMAKGKQFTESEKYTLLSVQQDIIRALIPLFRRLQERGQIELSTTPLFHPILPLLIDTDFARRARPDCELPPRFAHPEDAEAQLRMAIDRHQWLFGTPPQGLWPSEGSVCPELVPMLVRQGVRWSATDEAILAASLESWHRDGDLYRPYSVTVDDAELAFLFRDRELSDAIGFVYSQNDPAASAADFGARLVTIAERSPDPRPLVSVILDGENPWEYYPDGGEGFLRGVYTALSQGEWGGVRCESVTPARDLEEHPPRARLARLHTGSWINADFRIWLGQAEDNDAWERLGRVRRFLVAQEASASAERLQVAWKELYAAEGSDWFWWYGDDFATDHKGLFDHLFRLHLGNVYRLLDKDVPEFLLLPIWRGAGVAVAIQQPTALITPSIDGMVTDFYEWRGAGYFEGRAPLSAMHKGGLFRRVYFGFNLEQFYLRFDLAHRIDTMPTGNGESPNGAGDSLEVQVEFLEPHHTRLAFFLNAPAEFTLLTSRDGTTFHPERGYRTISGKKIIELAVPLRDLGLEPRAEARLVIKILEAGLERERLPGHQPLVITVPDHTFESMMWKA